MLPILSGDDQVNTRPIDSVFFCEPGAITVFSGVLTSDFKNLFFGENAMPVLFSRHMWGLATAVRSAFFGHIAHIVGVGANKKMRRVHAWWIVACVKDEKPVGNRANHQQPSHPMSLFYSVFKSKVTVPIGVFATDPFPTMAHQTNAGLTPKSNPQIHQNPYSTAIYGGQW